MMEMNKSELWTHFEVVFKLEGNKFMYCECLASYESKATSRSIFLYYKMVLYIIIQHIFMRFFYWMDLHMVSKYGHICW